MEGAADLIESTVESTISGDHCKPNRLFVVECCNGREEKIETKKIKLKNMDRIMDFACYSKPFPDNNNKHHFRIKIVYEKGFSFYLTYWKPVNLSQNADIAFKVNIREYKTPTTFGSFTINVTQERYNDWKFIIQCIDTTEYMQLTIEEITINNPPLNLEQPNPLSSIFIDENQGKVDPVELIANDSSKIKVLQCVLESHSEVFSRMFSDEWLSRNPDKCVHLKELNGEALQEFKAYLYCSAVPEKRADQLFSLANMYGMEHLRFCCANKLYEHLTPDNAMEIMQMASLYEYKPLVRALMLYFEENRLELDL